MENERVIAFIRKHMATGRSEAELRRFLLSRDLTQSRIDNVFSQYYQAQAPQKPVKITKPRPLRKKRLRKSSKGRWILMTLLILLPLAAGGGLAYRYFTRKVPVTPLAAKQLSDSEKRQADVSLIAGAVSQYAVASNALPTTTSVSSGRGLQLCGAICDPTTSDVFTLNIYDPSQVKFMAYTPTLTVPTADAIYLVPGAQCAGGSGIGGPNPKARSMVLLYGVLSGTTVAQHCLKL